MRTTLSIEQKNDILFRAFCNSAHLHYGAMFIFSESDASYMNAKKRLKDLNPMQQICREDIWIGVLQANGKLILNDCEDNTTHPFDLSKAFESIDNLPINIIRQFINEEDDGDTADYVLEYIMYGEKIYG